MPTVVGTKSPNNRVVELDALRALAAINLMLFHFTHVYTVKYGYSSELGWEWPYGKYGVQLFFMLSGYVNAMTLFRKQQPGDFIASRLIRIVPLFMLAIGLNLIVLVLAPHAGVIGYSWEQVATNLTIMPNLFGHECLEPVTWTLQVELLFYAIMIGLFWASRQVGLWRPLLTYLGFSLVAGLILRMADPNSAHWAGLTTAWIGQLLIVKYFPLFAMGISLYELRSGRSQPAICALGLILAATVFHVIDDHDHNPVVTLLLLGGLSLAAYGRLPWLGAGPLLFISGISYSLYLLHNNLGCVLIHQLDRWGIPPNLCLVVAVVFAVTTAGLVTKYFERPLSRRLRSVWQNYRGRRAVVECENPVAAPASQSAPSR